MASYIETLKRGNDQVIPRTTTKAITTEDGELLDDILDAKVDKVSGKGLSTNDYDATAKGKVDAIPADPKYTDTVYDDTAIKGRVSTIEGKESGWDAKYNKPAGGIPSSDMSSAVQTSLGLANTALQSAPVTSVDGSTGAVVLSDVKYTSQSLTTAQKEQARTNIGAGTISAVNGTPGDPVDVNADTLENHAASYFATASDLAQKVNYTENTLQTTSKNVVGAINEVNTRINNINSIGRFLAYWNCTTGLPLTNPSVMPYTYKTGDYYVVSAVGATNYKPNGSSYNGTASTTTETAVVAAQDIFRYDGTSWALAKNTNPDLSAYVATFSQSFTTGQKAQARTNVGLSDETWTFTLSDNTTVTKKVVTTT